MAVSNPPVIQQPGDALCSKPFPCHAPVQIMASNIVTGAL